MPTLCGRCASPAARCCRPNSYKRRVQYSWPSSTRCGPAGTACRATRICSTAGATAFAATAVSFMSWRTTRCSSYRIARTGSRAITTRCTAAWSVGSSRSRPQCSNAPAWGQLVRALGNLFAAVRAVPRWYIEAHQFRIDTCRGHRPSDSGRCASRRRRLRRRDPGQSQRRAAAAKRACSTRKARRACASRWSSPGLRCCSTMRKSYTRRRRSRKPGRSGVRDTLVLTFRADRFQAP